MNRVKSDNLDREEREILSAAEAGNYKSVLTDARRKELASVADNTFRKDKRINIRISNRDLTAIQAKASVEGVPYQTLVSSVIHKYISGSLEDLTASRADK